MHKFHWPPSQFFALDPYEQAFVVAAIDTKVENDKKEAAKIKSKTK